MKHSAVASSPGKINIFFAVGSLFPDKYHEVASLYFAVELRERITIKSSADWSVSVTGNIPKVQLDQVPTGDENLAVRICKELAELSEISELGALEINIDKHVPVAGGMGGGSADAAAAMMAADAVWNTGVVGDKMLTLAGQIGADIPFALLGGVAIGTGKGHKLSSVEGVKKFHWVLVTTVEGLSTPEVYAGLDELRKSRGEDPRNQPKPQVPAELIEALQSGDAKKLAPLLKNDLQEIALSLMPKLSSVMQLGMDNGALAVIVSGSGPTLAMLVEDSAAAQSLANYLAISGHSAITTSGPATGTVIESD